MTSPRSTPVGTARPRRRVQLLVAVAVAVVAAVIIGIVVVTSAGSRGGPTKTTDQPASHDTYAAAEFAGWVSEGMNDRLSHFSVQSTHAHSGMVSLRVDSTAPATVKDRRSLDQTITVKPLALYTITAWVRSEETRGSTARIVVGAGAANEFALPSTRGAWKKVHFNFTATSAATQALKIVTTTRTTGLLIDQLEVTPAAGGTTVLPNGSFEQYSAPTRITSTSLVQVTGSASLTVTAFGHMANWTVQDENGVVADTGTETIAGGVSTIPLGHLDQGYYTFTVHPDAKLAASIATPVMVLDKLAKGRKQLDERFGIGIHMLGANYAGSEPLVSQLGFGEVRDDAVWGVIEPAAGAYAFPSAYEKTYAAFAKEGVQVLPIADYSNKFYDDGRTPSTPAGVEAYARYANALVGHFSSPAIEVYNEPNGFADGACGRTPACYLPLLKAAYKTIKADHPNTTIVGPAIAFQDNSWLKQFYDIGGLNYLDAVSFHPYGWQNAPEYLAADLAAGVAQIKASNNGVSKPLWVTELGFTTNTTGNGISERAQSDYLVRSEVLSLSSGASKFFSYDLVNDSLDPTDHEGNFGIFRAPTAAVAAFAPKPAAMAQAVVIRELSGKAFVSRDSIGDASYSYVYGKGTDATRVAWSPTPSTVNYATTTPVKLITEYGHTMMLQPKDGHVTVRLSAEPIYIEGAVTGAAIGADSVFSVSLGSPTAAEGTTIPATISADLTGTGSASGAIVFTLGDKTYTIDAIKGKVTKKTVTLPASWTLGARTLDFTVGGAHKPDIYLTSSITITK